MTGSSDEAGFGRETVMRATGVTYRQLDYWARQGVVTPSVRDARGSGSQRRYSFTDIVELRTIKKLLDAGVSLPKIRRALEYVRKDLGLTLREVTLASDGKRVYALTQPNEIVDVLSGGQGVFAIAVDKVVEELEGQIAAFRSRAEADERQAGETTEAHGG